jgi:hypothetical protein
MASIRRGYSDDFTLKNNSVGIGTSTGQEALDVVDGAVKGQGLKVTGVSSFTAYEGFLRADQQIAENTTLSFDQGPSASLSGEIIVGTGVTVTIASVGLGTTMVGVGTHTIENTIDTTDSTRAGGSEIECLKVYNTFTPPSGGTNQRPEAPKPGELYYNYDFKTIEFFDGYGWRQVDNTTRSGRAVFMGGQTLSPTRDLSSMEYINISSLGNGVNFGEMSEDKQYTAGASSSTRGLIAGGYNPGASPSGVVDTIEYITIASAGGSIDFGNLSDARGELDGCGSSTRGLFMGGEDIPFANMNIIDYVEFATLGNALDFGDITVARRDTTCLSSPTRGFCAGGVADSPVNRVATIDVVTIAAKGNAIEFGDLSQTKNMGNGGCSNSVRGLFGGGQAPYTTNMIDYITMASNGNAIVFGELTTVRNNIAAVSTQIRGVFGSGFDSPSSITNTIDYVTIASTGGAVDFGDMSTARSQNSAVSDSHGGLGGF